MTCEDNMSNSDLGYQWWLKVRNAPVIRQTLPLEASLSYPVIGDNELHYFHYRYVGERLLRPFTHVIARLPDLTDVELVLERDKPLYPDLPDPEPAFVASSWSLALEKSLLNLYPLLVRLYPKQAAGALGTQYLEVFQLVTPPALKPFYSVLNPDFFVWLAVG